MPIMRIESGAVLLSGDERDLTVYAVAVTQRFRHRNGLPPLASLVVLRAVLSPNGPADTTPEATGQATETVGSETAAALMGVSSRTARRLAIRLGGWKVAGRWLLDRQAVLEHIEGAANAKP